MGPIWWPALGAPSLPSMDTPTHLRFGEFTFEVATGELLGPTGPQRLQPQPAQVLTLLATRGGELVSREELQARIWPETKVEFDQGINYCIRQIRAALGENADAPRFIETLPRRGYRFLVPVERGVAGAGTPRPRTHRRFAIRVSLAALVVVAGLMWVRGRAAPVQASLERLVLLPLADPGFGAGDTGAFNRALSEALVVELTRLGEGRLAVIGPATTQAAVDAGEGAPAIGERLGADFLVSGGARAADSLVFVQLVRASDGAHLFAERVPYLGTDPTTLAQRLARDLLEATTSGSDAR